MNQKKLRIDNLSLANFRGFEQIDIDFDEQLTVIAGINGVGKSSILYALSVLISQIISDFTPIPSNVSSISQNFESNDIYLNRDFLEISLDIHIDQFDFYILKQWRSENEEKKRKHIPYLFLLENGNSSGKKQFKTLLENRQLTGGSDQSNQDLKNALNQLKNNKNQPLFVYYSPRRQLPGNPKTLPKSRVISLTQAYSLALGEREVELREFLFWFNAQIKLDKDKSSSNPILKALQDVVHLMIPEFTNLRLEEEPELKFIVDKNNKPLYFQQLSDGEKGLLAIVFDLTRRLAIANPESSNPIAEGEAVVMIDEIELHLHPSWQRQVLQKLTSTFKNSQFIVTTHSPIVLSEVEAKCIRFLEKEEESIEVFTPSEAFGLDVNRILDELMDVRERNEETDEQIHKIFQLIDKENFDLARKKMILLIEKIGEDDPAITRAKSLIKFLEGES